MVASSGCERRRERRIGTKRWARIHRSNIPILVLEGVWVSRMTESCLLVDCRTQNGKDRLPPNGVPTSVCPSGECIKAKPVRRTRKIDSDSRIGTRPLDCGLMLSYRCSVQKSTSQRPNSASEDQNCENLTSNRKGQHSVRGPLRRGLWFVGEFFIGIGHACFDRVEPSLGARRTPRVPGPVRFRTRAVFCDGR